MQISGQLVGSAKRQQLGGICRQPARSCVLPLALLLKSCWFCGVAALSRETETETEEKNTRYHLYKQTSDIMSPLLFAQFLFLR